MLNHGGDKQSRRQNQLAFAKMQGVGNDFVVIDGRHYGDLDWSALAIEICDRKFGVGADGLLVLDETRLADIMMRMYNPDGSPDVCGNGLRCVARFAVERRIVTGDAPRIATLAGTRACEIHRGANGAFEGVTVEMGMPRFDPASIPMSVLRQAVQDYPLEIDAKTSLPISALSTGSTHAITFVDELPDDRKFLRVSPVVEMHPLFPERTSLMWCRVENPEHLRIRIWERGAGETLGCGTGACATAVAAVLHGYSPQGERITVSSVGGDLVIRWKRGEPIFMTGPAEYVYDGVYQLEPNVPAGASWV